MTMNTERGTGLMPCAVSGGVVVGRTVSYAWQWASQAIRHTVTQSQASQKFIVDSEIQEGASR